jgi:hypothetical protein
MIPVGVTVLACSLTLLAGLLAGIALTRMALGLP